MQTASYVPFQNWCIRLSRTSIFRCSSLVRAPTIAIRRVATPHLNQLKSKFTKRTQMARDERTDVRTVKHFLPETLAYDPEDYIDLNKGVFVGLDRVHKPQYIPLLTSQKQHADIIGTTGAGKGVASGLILYQLILADEGVFVMDPKNDEWAPHLMKYACEKAGKPFYLIDLNKKVPQLDLLGCNAGTNRRDNGGWIQPCRERRRG
nr:ATP-binding protein [Vibrio parahaemolyticus]